MRRTMTLRAVALAPALLLITSCGFPALPEINTPKPKGFPGDAWNKMHKMAASDMRCDIGTLQAKRIDLKDGPNLTTTSFEITGCDKTAIVVVEVSSSESWEIISDWDLRKKLAFSYGDTCPGWTVEYIDAGTRGVTACDQKLVYISSPSGWVANTITSEKGNTE